MPRGATAERSGYRLADTTMFDFSFGEIALIGIVALVVIGPERLPRVARTAGVLFGRMQRYVTTVKADIAREMELDELKQLHGDVTEAARSMQQTFTQHVTDAQAAVTSVASEVNSTMSSLNSGMFATAAGGATAAVAESAAAGAADTPAAAPVAELAPPAPDPHAHGMEAHAHGMEAHAQRMQAMAREAEALPMATYDNAAEENTAQIELDLPAARAPAESKPS